jgi:peptidoglycan/xylan/chitin deacetylase (PgdA/CDA1 family)
MMVLLWIGGVIFFLFLCAFLFWKFRLYARSHFKAPVLLFHKIEPQSEWGVTSLKPAKFSELVGLLKEQGYQSLTLEEFSGADLTDFRRKVLITFDDGYEGIYHHASPVLEKSGYTAAVFVITGYVGKENSWDMNLGGKKFKHLSWEQIKKLVQKGWSVGSHTVNHYDLTKLNQRQLEYELKQSKRDLEDNLNREIVSLSYPFGRFNQPVQEEVLRQGYQHAFSIYPARENRLNENLAFKRIAMYRLDSPLSLRIKLNGGLFFWLEDLKGFLINRLSLATTLLKPSLHFSNGQES